jgi:hypothetical protein
VINDYRDFVTAENNYVNDNKQASPTAFTATEQEQICTSLITVSSSIPLQRPTVNMLTSHSSLPTNTRRFWMR